jgi:hypothetical protein
MGTGVGNMQFAFAKCKKWRALGNHDEPRGPDRSVGILFGIYARETRRDYGKLKIPTDYNGFVRILNCCD